jgi:ketosteroid isomerase-like protein
VAPVARAVRGLRLRRRWIADCGGDDVFVVAREHGTGALSDAPVGARIYQVITVIDGKVRRYREFYDEKAALEAAGLEE